MAELNAAQTSIGFANFFFYGDRLRAPMLATGASGSPFVESLTNLVQASHSGMTKRFVRFVQAGPSKPLGRHTAS
ncbi:MAG: hypothetical protein U0X20_00565 [Caldilineaceae bacterium]